jgi:DNA-directed RNA polymerase subunit M/transcription elongation factor TFIIS
MNYREKGKSVLSSVLQSEKNVKLFENAIYSISDSEEGYNRILYEIAFKLSNEDRNIKNILQDIKKGYVLENDKIFDEIKFKQKEKEEYLSKPIEVEEGVFTCEKCQSKKTYSHSKQVRSSDEGFTTFVFCLNCGQKWRIN